MQTPDFYWLRQPLMSIERLLALLAEDCLTDLLHEEQIVEAIRIAWPSIGEHLRDSELVDSKVTETIVKYILRLSTRCTPFGMFAGGVVGYSAAVSAFDFRDRHLLPQHRLDTQVLVSLAYKLTHQPTIRMGLRYFANRSVHRVGNRFRYTESHWQAGQWQYFSSEVSVEDHLLTVLSLAKEGASIAELVQAISTHEHQTEAYEFIEHLIEDGLLVSSLMPTPMGPDPLTRLIQKLDGLCPPPSVLAHLHEIQTLLNQYKGGPQPAQEVTQILTEQVGLSVEPGCVLQTDLQITGGPNQLSRNVLNQLGRTLASLHILNRFNAETPELATFKQRFHARYEEQEIPLLFALDDEMGVGYASAIGSIGSVHDLLGDLLTQSAPESIPTFQADKLHELRMQLYSAWLLKGDAPVEITDQDLTTLDKRNSPAPESYYAYGYFLAPSAAAIDAGCFQFALKALSGPSAFTLMGRFCSTDDALKEIVVEHMNWQQAANPTRIFAEVVHLPQARTGNVVQRPHLRAHEIPFLIQSDLPVDQQIFPDDLLISVPHGQRVVLRSKKLNKEIIPQLTSAHNYRSGLPLYQFLCDLQAQYNPLSVSWHWGALSQARRLPRVHYRNIILQEATWLFTQSDLLPALSDEENIARLRTSEGLPRLVAIRQGDQELFIDLDSSSCRQLVVSTLRRLKKIQVIEWLRTPENCPLLGPDGRLTHEVIIPFTDFTRQPTVAEEKAINTPSSSRNFPPGSEWLYVKVYCGPSTARALLDRLIEFADQCVNDGLLTHWFFIRYKDPEYHLRVRFRISHADQSGTVLVACQQALSSFLSSGEVYRFQVDTYHRELERYGEITIDQTERIFWRDSEAVGHLLKLDLTESTLFSAALLGIDAYQTAFGLTPIEKLRMCEQVFNELFDQHGATSSLRKTLAYKYRLNQPMVIRILQQKITAEENTIYQTLQNLHQLIRLDIDQIRRSQSTQPRSRQLHYIGSLGHLFINRLFETNQRTYELLVYHHLYRANQSLTSCRSH